MIVKNYYDLIPIYNYPTSWDTLPMFTHAQIWAGIDRLADSLGYSTSGLAKKAGLDPTTFNKSKRFSSDGKERWPTTESINKVLQVTGASLNDLAALMDDPDSKTKPTKSRAIPVIGLSNAQKNDAFTADGLPKGNEWDDILFPDHNLPSQAKLSLFALEVSGNNFKPTYRDGDILVMSPTSPIRRGDRVLVKFKSGDLQPFEMLRHTASRIELKDFSKSLADLTLKSDNVLWLARIVWASQ